MPRAVDRPSVPLESTHDYIVVGAGTAGCVIARRLSDDPSCRVLLLEAGAAHQRELYARAPATFMRLMRSPLDWNFTTVPQHHVDNREMYWPRGKGLGGSSTINALVYIRGHRANFDDWAALGNTGWGYEDVLPLFKRAEDNERGECRFHGRGGLQPVSDARRRNAVGEAFVEATVKRCGVAVNPDFNGATQEGAGRYQLTTRKGERAGAADFLEQRPNLEVVTDAHITRLVVERGRVCGVMCQIDGREELLRAAVEVIVCAGAIGSPHLLLVSGIGPADELRAAGTDVVVDLPGVGKNLQDHIMAPVVLGTDSTACAGPLSKWQQLVHRWSFTMLKRGPWRTAPVEYGAFLRSSSSAPRPDLQLLFCPWGTPESRADANPATSGRRLSFLVSLMYPRSVGEIRLTSSDARVRPAIDPRYFSDGADLNDLVSGIKIAREIAATGPLAGHVVGEIFPGPGCTTDDQLRAAVRARCNTNFHAVGTCKMGPERDTMAVVDPRLRVRGVDGLRVADASIMPRIVGGNTNAAVAMIAEKAAELIRC